MWDINNDIPIKIPRDLYVLVNRSVLCNCGIEAGKSFSFRIFGHMSRHKFKTRF